MTPDCKQMHVLEYHNTADSIHCCSRLRGGGGGGGGGGEGGGGGQ